MKSPHLGGPHLDLNDEDPNDAFRRLISWSFAVAPLFGRKEGGRVEMGDGGIISKALNAIRAYHGSPHKFDKFDISKIGTGEGAQAYGHGLYFAGNEDVARGYRDRLSDRASSFNIDTFPVPKWILKKLELSPDREKAISEVRSDFMNRLAEAEQEANSSHQPWLAYGRINSAKDVLSGLDRIERGATIPETTGHMYEVNLHADPEHMLDWDSPLGKQSPFVQNVLREVAQSAPSPKAGPAIRNRTGILEGNPDTPGDILYNNIGGYRAPAETSSKLLEQGIPGIKYLDQGSRGAGEGSHNYVMFSHDPVEILRRYEKGGRIGYANTGAVDDIDAAIRAANEASQRQGMTHEKGFSGNVEFAPLEIEEPLTHAKLPLGTYPRGTTETIQPALQAASEVGPYFTPAAPIAAARDVAVGLKEGDPANVALSALGLPGKAAKAAAIGASALMPDEAEAGPLIKALNAIRAYHGSPHKFDKFDISKIGTGEGAQAYGHGLYFAGNEDAAKYYRDAITRRDRLWDQEPEQGHMYEVNLHADPEHMLDWYKPLSQQSRVLQKIKENLGGENNIKQLNDEYDNLFNMENRPVIGSEEHKRLDNRFRELQQNKAITLQEVLRQNPDVSGKNFYYRFGGKNPEDATKTLSELGIPGIKYLDQGSRGAGEGSHNYVMFSHDPVEILRRYKQGGKIDGRQYDLGGYVSESKKIPSAASEVWKSDLMRLLEKMDAVREDEDKYADGGSIVDHALEVLSQHSQKAKRGRP